MEEYETPEAFELGNLRDETHGSNGFNDADDTQYDQA